jgi:hypothetical protein
VEELLVMANDFGWFLVWLGVVGLVFITPMNLESIRNPYILPLGLILFGFVNIVLGFIGIRDLTKLKDIAFAVFIVLLLKAYVWDFPTIFFIPAPYNTNYSNSFITGSPVFSCDVCNTTLVRGEDLSVFVEYSDAHAEVIESADGVRLKQKDPLGGGNMLITLPDNASSLKFDSGVGSIEGVLEGVSANVSLGVGAIELTLDLDNCSVIADTGVGGVHIMVNEVLGDSFLILNTGVGGVEVWVPDGIEYSLVLKAGLGGVNNYLGAINSAGYDSATNRLFIKADVGVGGIEVKKIS